MLVACALLIWEKAQASVPLDLEAGLLKAERSGIEAMGTRDDTVWIQTSETTLKSVIALPLPRDFSPRTFDLLDIRMKTDARVHGFSFHWLHTDHKGSTKSFVIERPTYRDDQFHRYVIRLDLHPAWTGSIQGIGLGWIGSHASIEIESAQLEAMTFADWVTYEWLQFWTPELLRPLSVHAIPGPRVFDLPFASLLAATCLGGMAIVMLARLRRLRDPRQRSAEWSSPTLASLLFVLLVGCWIIYDLRDVHSHLQTLDSERRHFLAKPVGTRHYFELDDLQDFLDAVDRRLPQGESVAFFSSMPHDMQARYRLYPRRVMPRDPTAPSVVVFQDPTITFRNGHLFEGGIPMQGQFERLWQFGPSAEIFRKIATDN
jgi:hypothetical protein